MVGSSGRRIVVEFIGDASSLGRSVDSAGNSLSSFSSKAQATGRIAGKVLAGGLLLAAAAAVKATQAAAEDEAAQSQLAQQLRQAAGATDGQIAATEAWITAQGVATGITDDELRPALAKLATATGDVAEAQRLATLAIDVAAGSGKTYQQVTEAMVKAQNGSVGGLARLGVATKNAAGETMTFAEIQQSLATKYMGAAAKAAETTAGKQKILTTQFAELQEQIGAKLLPVMVKLGEVGLKVVSWISENTRVVGIFLAALGSLLAITWAVGVATKAFAAVQLAWSAIMAVVTAAQWLLNAAMTANPIGLVVVAIALLVAGLILAYKHSETFRNIVNAAFGAIKGIVLSVVGWFGKYVPAIFLAVKEYVGTTLTTMKAIILAVWDTIVGAVKTVLGVYRTIIVTAFNAIREYLGNVVAGWKTLFNNAWDVIKSGFAAVRDKFIEIAGAIRDKVAGAFNAIKDSIQPVIDRVQWLIDKIQALIDKIKSIPGIPGVGKVAAKANGRTAGRAGDTEGAVAAAAGVVDAVGAARAGASAGAARGGDTFNIYLQTLDPATAGKAVIDALRKAERATGRKLLVSPA